MLVRSLSQVVRLVTIISTIYAAGSSEALAAGKGKKPAPQQPNVCTVPTAAVPRRPIALTPVESKEFPLPNGAKIDLTPELTEMLGTAGTEIGAFAPSFPGEPVPADPCNTYLTFHGRVTALEMNLYEYGFTVGYSPAGPHAVKNINGQANIRVGKIAMDFSVRKCVGEDCRSILATHVDQSMIDADEKITADFGTITTGAAFAQHPSFNKILRSLFNKAMNNLVKDPEMSLLPWRATVREYDAASGAVYFDAGAQSHLAPNQKFVIYVVNPGSSACAVHKVVAATHAVRVDPVSTFALVDEMRDSRGIQVGDQVMISNE